MSGSQPRASEAPVPALTPQTANPGPAPATTGAGPYAMSFPQNAPPASGPQPQIHPVYPMHMNISPPVLGHSVPANYGPGQGGFLGNSSYNHFSRSGGAPRPVVGTMQLYNKQKVDDMIKENAELKETIKGQSADLVGIQEANLEMNGKLASFMEPQSTVTFIVGTQHKSFIIHENLLHSPFFKAAFGGEFKESLEGSMKLEDVEVEVFFLLKHWLYTGEIKFDIHAASYDRLFFLAKLWNLAQRCFLPKLQNKAIYVLYNEFKNLRSIPQDVMDLVYDNEYRSALKRLVVFFWVNFAGKESVRDSVDAFPDSLKTEVLIGLKDKLFAREITKDGTSASQFYVEIDDEN